MITLTNSLSFIRAPLALLFLFENTHVRLFAIVFAALTDGIDGYLARKYKSTSKFGAILDPAMDKFFVYFVLGTLFVQNKIEAWEMATMLSRDFFLFIYGAIMVLTKKWKTIEFRAVRWGKVTTALQFVVLFGIVYGISFSWIVFAAFVMMGWLAFLELFQITEKNYAF